MELNYSAAAVPITWGNRRTSVAKLNIREMHGHYLFICMYV